MFQISNFKLQIPRERHGYTLVEITVVMGIIALLMVVGAGAFFSVRDQYIADSATEEAITAVREAQNRAISFSQGTAGSTKAWAANFNANDGLSLVSLRVDSNGQSEHHTEYDYKIASGTTLSSPNYYIYFTSPFGTTYLFDGECNNWVEDTTNPSHEYIPSCPNSLAAPITIDISYRNSASSITINDTGDISAN